MKQFDIFIADAKEIIRLGRGNATIGHASYNLAAVYVFLGKKEEAYIWLRKLIDIGIRNALDDFMLHDPLFESLWEEEEFERASINVKIDIIAIRKQIEQIKEDD